MSTPIIACKVYKAAKGDEDSFNFLLEAMKYNCECGHFSSFRCMCDPPCEPPTEEQLAAYGKRMNGELDKWQNS